MLRITVRTRQELERRLLAAYGLSIAEYDALVPMGAAPGARIRMAELADEILQPRSTLTRLISGLEQRGYEVRQACDDGARGTCAALTPLGAKVFREAQALHHANVRELITDRLSDRQLRQLAAACSAIDPTAKAV